MFTRFRDSLVYPGRIINFRNDRFWTVFSYILLFSVLMSLGVIVFVLNFNQVNYAYQEQFKDNLDGSNINCVIENDLLTCDEDTEMVQFYEDDFFTITVDNVTESISFENYDTSKTNFIFHDDLVIFNLGFMSYEMKLTEFDFGTIDLKLVGSDNEQFTEVVMGYVSDFMNDTKVVWGSVFIGIEIITNLFFIILIALINSWILKSRFKIIPFKEVFKMSVYTGTALFLLLTFNGMVNLGIFMLFLFIMLSFRQTNALSMAIVKVIKKK